MATSQTEIVNLALSEIGADPILSLDDPKKQAILAKLHWKPLTEAVFRAYPWNCGRRVEVLAAETSVPPGNLWSNQFLRLPTDVRVMNCDAPTWKIAGRRILANTNILTVEFIEYIDDVTQWDSLLVQAVVARLGHVLALPLAQSGSMRDAMWDSYIVRIREARSIDAQEGSGDSVEADDWLAGRA